MISGLVRGDDACIRLVIKGRRGRQQEIEAVIDTGYTASLTLPAETIAALRLRWRSVGRGILADGSECLFDVYETRVLWDGHWRDTLVDEADTEPLVGMRSLRGYELNMQIRTRGKLTIKRLP